MLVLRILRTTSFDLFTPSRLGCGRYHMYFLALFSDQLWTYCLQSTEDQAQNASLWQGIGIQIENGGRQSCIKLFKEHGRRVSPKFLDRNHQLLWNDKTEYWSKGSLADCGLSGVNCVRFFQYHLYFLLCEQESLLLAALKGYQCIL